MSNKMALLGMPSPDETPGIREKNEIQTTQPAGRAGPPEPGGGMPAGRKPGSSDWFDRIEELARELEEYRSIRGDQNRSRVHRDRFYQGVWEMAGRCAQHHLRCQNWKGDVTQDAMDITAVFCERLAAQEENQKGIFDSSGRSRSQLRGYLSRTIQIGVRQQAGKFRRSRREWLSFEQDAVLAAVEARKSDWLPQVLRLTKALDSARKGVRKLPPVSVGTTSLDLVLRLALNRKVQGGEVKRLVPRKGVPPRTRQRREKCLRDNLRQALEI